MVFFSVNLVTFKRYAIGASESVIMLVVSSFSQRPQQTNLTALFIPQESGRSDSQNLVTRPKSQTWPFRPKCWKVARAQVMGLPNSLLTSVCPPAYRPVLRARTRRTGKERSEIREGSERDTCPLERAPAFARDTGPHLTRYPFAFHFLCSCLDHDSGIRVSSACDFKRALWTHEPQPRGVRYSSDLGPELAIEAGKRECTLSPVPWAGNQVYHWGRVGWSSPERDFYNSPQPTTFLFAIKRVRHLGLVLPRTD
ncbi:hypothetical protein NMY22_g19573 [Coprinellus aureogranulatus]|nr:hypothetical protein NMY22_g19573 [Coprinellus aureogranulatus]